MHRQHLVVTRQEFDSQARVFAKLGACCGWNTGTGSRNVPRAAETQAPGERKVGAAVTSCAPDYAWDWDWEICGESGDDYGGGCGLWIRREGWLHRTSPTSESADAPTLDHCVRCEATIFLHPVYEVPALSVEAWDCSGSPLTHDMLLMYLSPTPSVQESHMFITECAHPHSSRPVFIFHPCETASTLGSLLQQVSARTDGAHSCRQSPRACALLYWFNIYGGAAGMHMPPAFFRRAIGAIRNTDMGASTLGWIVLCAGEHWKTTTGDRWLGQHCSLTHIARAYEKIVSVRGRRRIIVIAQLEETLHWLEVAAATGIPLFTKGITLNESAQRWCRKLEETRSACQCLIEDGGAQYDGRSCNPATLIGVTS